MMIQRRMSNMNYPQRPYPIITCRKFYDTVDNLEKLCLSKTDLFEVITARECEIPATYFPFTYAYSYTGRNSPGVKIIEHYTIEPNKNPFDLPERYNKNYEHLILNETKKFFCCVFLIADRDLVKNILSIKHDYSFTSSHKEFFARYQFPHFLFDSNIGSAVHISGIATYISDAAVYNTEYIVDHIAKQRTEKLLNTTDESSKYLNNTTEYTAKLYENYFLIESYVEALKILKFEEQQWH